MTQYVQLNSDETAVVTVFAGPQAITSDKPGYAEIADSDARFAAWQLARTGQAAYDGALAAGCRIQSTATPSLDATYSILPAAEDNYLGLQAGIAASPPAPWIGYLRDINNAKVTMMAAQATEVMTGILGYIEALQAALANSLAGAAWVAPTTPVTIA